MFTGMFATIEGTEELTTGTNDTPFSQCVHIVIVRIVNSIILKVGNTMVERRLQLLEEFLKKNGGITRLEYSSLTGLPRLKAIEDLNNFVVAGTLRKRGTGRAVFYVWKQEE